jgi:hypothetical protein
VERSAGCVAGRADGRAGVGAAADVERAAADEGGSGAVVRAGGAAGPGELLRSATAVGVSETGAAGAPGCAAARSAVAASVAGRTAAGRTAASRP